MLTGTGITKHVTYWNPDVLVTYNGVLWETFPVEVVARPLPNNPTLLTNHVPAIEQALFNAADVEIDAFKKYLRRHDLALLVTRDVTSRDDPTRSNRLT